MSQNDQRDRMLGELRQRAGGIDPVLDQAENYGKGIRAVQRVTRAQGQVMSATLSNNAMLWEERKQLRAMLDELKHDLRELQRTNETLELRLAERDEAIAKLEAAGGDRWRALYESARTTLNGYLHDQLDEDDLKTRLEAMRVQQEQLLTEGAELAPLPDRGAVDEEIVRQGLDDL